MIDFLLQSLKAQLAHLEINSVCNKPCYISLKTEIDSHVNLVPTNIRNCFYISKPDAQFTLLGLGAFLTIKSTGHDRFQYIRSEFNTVLDDWIDNSESDQVSPIAFLGFAFDENDPMDEKWRSFPNTALIIPQILIKEHNNQQTLTVHLDLSQNNYELQFDKITEHLQRYLESLQKNHLQTNNTTNISQKTNIEPSWFDLSNKAMAYLHSGQFEKLVISRQTAVDTDTPINVQQVVGNLEQHYPACTILSYHCGEHTLLAASPEKLLTLKQPYIHSDAIGGTVERDKGNNSQQTRTLSGRIKPSHLTPGNETREGKKLLKEHAIIAQDIYHRLDPLCKTLKMPVSPLLMKLHNLYHLETPIQGRLMDSLDLFDVLETLHPTPAVAGFPAKEARQWLLENEHYHRGWYTGGFGWVDSHRNGELSVLLRCAIIKEKQVNLFAGAGLVSESDPDTEWHETDLKMQTILEMLQT